MSSVIGCCVRVHTALGPGLVEAVYSRALEIEFQRFSLPYEREKRVVIRYREVVVAEHRLDLVVADQIIVDLKAIERLAPVHHAQILGYLRASGMRLGLLVNFNVPVLGQGLRRVVP